MGIFYGLKANIEALNLLFSMAHKTTSFRT